VCLSGATTKMCTIRVSRGLEMGNIGVVYSMTPNEDLRVKLLSVNNLHGSRQWAFMGVDNGLVWE
jgi:hypothetical protein